MRDLRETADLEFEVTSVAVEESGKLVVCLADGRERRLSEARNIWFWRMPREDLTLWANRIGKRIRLTGHVEDM